MTERITITRPGSTYLWASHSTKGLLDRGPFAGLSQIDVLCKRLREAFPYAEILDQTNGASIVVQAPPTVIYLVQGEHWAVPGSPMTASATRAAADAKAAELVNVMLADCHLAADATATNWEEKLLALRQVRAEEAGIDYDECINSDVGKAIAEFMGDDDCDVWIDEIPVDGAAPPPADTYTAEDMDGVVAEVQDKIERRLLAPMRAALKAGRDAFAEALTTHIYDEANGDKPEPDCQYVTAIAQMDAVLARTAVLDPVLEAPQSDGLITELVVDAERWQALMSSQRMHFMGSAGFRHYNPSDPSDRKIQNCITEVVAEPGKEWLHFGMEFWDISHAYGNPEYPDRFERQFLTLYVDHLRARMKAEAKLPTGGALSADEVAGLAEGGDA